MLQTSPPSPVKRGLSCLRMSWIYVLCAQMILLFVIYRYDALGNLPLSCYSLVLWIYSLSTAHAKHYFLTTYYDPYYSELHLYTIMPEYPRHTTSIADAFWRDGLRGSAIQGLDNVITVICHWHNSLLRLWGVEQIATTMDAWPPT